ncbi:MAG: HAD family phosphatase [Burkholderiaceae bacterium]|nr:HAD family phosphatase [Microbacteriaceae bacterium]
MDGTLVDTEPYWMRAEIELIGSFGGEWTHEDGLQVVGMGLGDAAVIFQSRGVDLGVEEIIERMTTRVLEQVGAEVPWRPGARELLADLKRAGVPTAPVTMSMHRMADAIAGAIGFAAFDVIVGGDDVEHPKPHPAPYLHAAALLGVDIADCVAIEDSIPGLASAVASGAAVIGVPLHTPLEAGPTHTLWPTLDGVTADDLADLLAVRSAAVA